MGLAVDAPACLVDIQDGAVARLLGDGVVPGREDLAEPLPLLHQSATRDGEVKERIEHRHDLGSRLAQAVVEPARQRQGAVADGRLGQGVDDGRLDALVAPRAPVGTDGVFGGDDGRLLDVLDDAAPPVVGITDRSAALGARSERVVFVSIDHERRTASRAFVARFAATLFAAALGRRLLVGRDLRRWRGEIRRVLLLALREDTQLEQGPDHGLPALLEDLLGLFFAQVQEVFWREFSGHAGQIACHKPTQLP